MGTDIKVWEVVDGNLKPIETSMIKAGRKETEDLEKWIKSHPVVLGDGILIIGEQVPTKSGPIDYLGIDESGNLIITELKRDRLPREALAQAIDYAADVASWNVDKISEVCTKYTEQGIEDYLGEKFEDIDLEDLTINKTQRILLVGFSIQDSLQRMIEWLSDNYGVSINAVLLKYVKTESGDELIARTVIIPEELEKERTGRHRIRIPMSDEPGDYGDEELKNLLNRYFSRTGMTPRRIKEIFIPLCMKHDVLTREMLRKELIDRGEAQDDPGAGRIIGGISRMISFQKHDYLRQVIQYDRPEQKEKDNYRLAKEYRDLVKNVLETLQHPGS